jgi:hypothetical protein
MLLAQSPSLKQLVQLRLSGNKVRRAGAAALRRRFGDGAEF